MRILSIIVPLLVVLPVSVVRVPESPDPVRRDTQRVRCRPADVRARAATATAASHASAHQGNILVASQFGSATIIDLETGATTRLDVAGSPHHADVSPDGRWGIVAVFVTDDRQLNGNRIYVVDMERKEIARIIDTGATRGLHDVSFRPGHPTRALVTAQTSRAIVEVDVVSGEVVGTVDTRGDRSHTLAVSPDGNVAFTANEATATISRLDVVNHRFVRTFPATDQVEGIALARNGSELWVGELRDSAVTVRDAVSGAVLERYDDFVAPNVIRATADGRLVVIADLSCATLTVADGSTRRLLRTIQMPRVLPIIGDFSPDGRIAFVSLASDAAVVAVDLESGEIVSRYPVHTHPDGLGWGPRPGSDAGRASASDQGAAN